MSDQDRISPNNINTTSSRQVIRIKKDINYQLLQTNVIKIVQQTFSKENYSLHLWNEWVYSKKFISQHLMINQFSPLADTHLLVWIIFLHSHDTSNFCGNLIECEARFIVNCISRS